MVLPYPYLKKNVSLYFVLIPPSKDLPQLGLPGPLRPLPSPPCLELHTLLVILWPCRDCVCQCLKLASEAMCPAFDSLSTFSLSLLSSVATGYSDLDGYLTQVLISDLNFPALSTPLLIFPTPSFCCLLEISPTVNSQSWVPTRCRRACSSPLLKKTSNY